MKGKLYNVLLTVILIAGLSLLLYPILSDYYNSWIHSQVIVEYSDQVSQLEQEAYDKAWGEAERYNAALLERQDPYKLTEEMEEQYWKMLALSRQGIMAYVEIPSIQVKLPIAHGTDTKTLEEFVGHMEWSSLPIGGEGTHCVVSGHRGLPSSELFTNIDHLVPGDRFYIHVLGQTLEYRVDHIAIVEPYDFTLLGIQEGKDYVTLVTCTPYGINSHRLLVRGVRSGTEESAALDMQVRNEVTPIDPMVIVPLVLVALTMVVFGVILLNGGKRKGREETHAAK